MSARKAKMRLENDKIETKEIVVYEMNIDQISAYAEEAILLASQDLDLQTIKSFIYKIIPECSNISESEVGKMYPGELEELKNLFMEANKPFLQILERAGFIDNMKNKFYLEIEPLQENLNKSPSFNNNASNSKSEEKSGLKNSNSNVLDLSNPTIHLPSQIMTIPKKKPETSATS